MGVVQIKNRVLALSRGFANANVKLANTLFGAISFWYKFLERVSPL